MSNDFILEKKFHELKYLNYINHSLDLEVVQDIVSFLPWQDSIYDIVDTFSDANLRFFTRSISDVIQAERVNFRIREILSSKSFLNSYNCLEEFAFILSSMGDFTLSYKVFQNEFDRISTRILELFEINKRSLDDALKLQIFIHTLSQEEGLFGNDNLDNYECTSSIFISQVLKNKTGIPVALSVIYLIVAWRLKLPIYGVNLPLHFILCYDYNYIMTYIDPYNGGIFLSKETCIKFLEANGFSAREDYFVKSDMTDIIKRLYKNLILLFKKEEKEVEKKALIYQLSLLESQI